MTNKVLTLWVVIIVVALFVFYNKFTSCSTALKARVAALEAKTP